MSSNGVVTDTVPIAEARGQRDGASSSRPNAAGVQAAAPSATAGLMLTPGGSVTLTSRSGDAACPSAPAPGAQRRDALAVGARRLAEAQRDRVAGRRVGLRRGRRHVDGRR